MMKKKFAGLAILAALLVCWVCSGAWAGPRDDAVAHAYAALNYEWQTSDYILLYSSNFGPTVENGVLSFASTPYVAKGNVRGIPYSLSSCGGGGGAEKTFANYKALSLSDSGEIMQKSNRYWYDSSYKVSMRYGMSCATFVTDSILQGLPDRGLYIHTLTNIHKQSVWSDYVSMGSANDEGYSALQKGDYLYHQNGNHVRLVVENNRSAKTITYIDQTPPYGTIDGCTNVQNVYISFSTYDGSATYTGWAKQVCMQCDACKRSTMGTHIATISYSSLPLYPAYYPMYVNYGDDDPDLPWDGPSILTNTGIDQIKVYTLENRRYYEVYSDKYLRNKKSASAWTGEGDEDWIEGVGKNSKGVYYARISYPADNGRLTAYVNLRDIFVAGWINEANTIYEDCNEFYDRRGSGYTNNYWARVVDGAIFPLARDDEWVQVLFWDSGSNGGRRIAWLTREKYNAITTPPLDPVPVVEAPSFVPEAVTGRGFSWRLSATNNPTSWATSKGSTLPPGLSLETSGVISGTATRTDAGDWDQHYTGIGYTFYVTATNSAGSSAPQKIRINVWQSPQITTGSTLPDGCTNTPYSVQIYANGTKMGMSWKLKYGTLPPGLSLDSASQKVTALGSRYATISGTPTTAGTYTFTLEVAAGQEHMVDLTPPAGKIATKTFTINIVNKPEITTSELSSWTLFAGNYFSKTIEATSTESVTWSISAGSLPPGLSLNSSTGTISGTLTSLESLRKGRGQKDYSFTVKAATKSGYDEKTYTLKVQEPFRITTGSLPNAWKDEDYTAEIYGEGGFIFETAIDYITWVADKNSLPPGMTLTCGRSYNASDNSYVRKAVISGKPTATGTYNVKVKALDVVDFELGSKTFPLVVKQKPAIETSATLPEATAGRPYSITLSASGTKPITWAKTGGTLPSGMTLSNTGILSGTPSYSGTYSFTVKASNGRNASRTFTLKVRAKPSISGTFNNGIRKAKYSDYVEVVGGVAPFSWKVIGSIPPDTKFTYSGAKATLSGTSTKAGTYNFTLTVTDKNGAIVSKAFTVKVTQTTVTGDIPTSTTRKASYTCSPKVSGGASPYTWSISAGKLPDGLKINASTGKITGNPTKADTFNFTVKAKDKNGAASTKAYTVKVTQTTVTGDIPTSTTRRALYTGSPKVSGGASPYTWSISEGKLPDGLKINASTGKITGTPTKAGTFKFTVKAKDKNGAAGKKEYTVKVTQTAVKGDIPATITRRAKYTGTPKVSGGAASYTWSISAGKLPDGLKINASTGKITGTPTKAGTFKFTVKAKDKNGAAGKKEYTVKVTQTAVKGDIPATITRRATFTGTPKVSGGASPYTWSISAGKLPDGLKINASTGKITGTATKAGTFKFTVKAKDKNGAASTKEYTVKVTQTKVTGTLANAVKGTSYTATPKASNGASPYVWSISAGSLPKGVKLNTSTGKITGTPTQTGSFTFTVKAKDKNGAAGTKEYTLKVTANTTKSATPESKPDTENDSEISTQEHNTVSALPVTPPTTSKSAGNTAITLTPSLRVISDDIIASDIGRDNDIFTVRAGQPLTLILDGKISDAIICIDDEPIAGITISDDGTFTLPAEFVNGDFKVQVKSSDGKNESQEAFLISE